MRDSMPSVDAVAGNAVDDLGPEPSPDRPRDRTAWQLRVQARVCAMMGSPLYGHLLDRAADDCLAGGPTWAVLTPHAAAGRGDALGLRFMAAVHRLVLQGQAPRLASFYPSAGGDPAGDGVWEAFAHTVRANVETLSELAALPCQTNEVGRSAALAVGFLHVMAETGLPLRLLEVGASAGLNLRCDHFRIGGAGAVVGDLASPVDLSRYWKVAPPDLPDRIDVVARRGCDRTPVDPTTVDGRLALTAAVWADQRDRLRRLYGAIELARRVPATVDQASLDAWTAAQLDSLPEGCVTVVFHSVVAEYLPAPVLERFTRALREAATRATTTAPLAWVRLEPVSALRHHGLEVTLWPGDDTRVLARCGAHGTDVEWLGTVASQAR